MILTLTWKEVREHRTIWLAMVVLTTLLGWGVGKLIAQNDPSLDGMPALMILGLAVTYGVVCGGMMFAGEHENGTLAFLDIFHGKRQTLWTTKLAIGIGLAIAEALAVASILLALGQETPHWVRGLLGGLVTQPRFAALPDHGPGIWLIVLPLVTVEAYVWGLLGSALTRRVLAAAGVAIVGLWPVWMFSLGDANVALVIRLLAMFGALAVSARSFVQQPRDVPQGPGPQADLEIDPREQRFAEWERADEEDEFLRRRRQRRAESSESAASAASNSRSEAAADDPSAPGERPIPARANARSPAHALFWLTWMQALPLVPGLVIGGFICGLLLPWTAQFLWPFATLVLGAICGCAAFAQEQRERSFQFLASQHLPLRSIWWTKLALWAAIALTTAAGMLLVFGVVFSIMNAPMAGRREPPSGFLTPLRLQMGWTLFLGVWLVYGFCLGQSFVWFFRKTFLAVMMTVLVAGAAIFVWMPSLLCGGMGGWQLWAPPIVMLIAGWKLVPFWAGGGILERRHLFSYLGFGAATLAWAGVCFAYRAWEIPDVGPPMDFAAFKSDLQADDNAAGKAYQQALNEFDPAAPRQGKWHAIMTDAARLPPGMIEVPRADGGRAGSLQLDRARQLIEAISRQASASSTAQAIDQFSELLALSRTMRNQSTLLWVRAGIDAESISLDGFLGLATRPNSSPAQLRRMIAILEQHESLIPSAVGSVRAECLVSSGLLDNPTAWRMTHADDPHAGNRRSLAPAIAVSLELPWEAERKVRLWRLVWGGLLRAAETPLLERQSTFATGNFEKPETMKILAGWIAPSEGPGASVAPERIGHWLDQSWLADDILITPVAELLGAADRSTCRVRAVRLALAVSLYQYENRPLARLDDLVPKVLRELPIDLYSGVPFRFTPEIVEHGGRHAAVVWSVGPDRQDHGGVPQFDLVTVVPKSR